MDFGHLCLIVPVIMPISVDLYVCVGVRGCGSTSYVSVTHIDAAF